MDFDRSSSPAADASVLDHIPGATNLAVPGAVFAAMGLASDIVRAIADSGYTAPTEVQARAVPEALTGVDLLVSSQTGSGKTAAFVWPALQRILDARNDPAKRRPKGQTHGPRVLVLTPTRELAMQVSQAASVYGRRVSGLRVAHVVGGVPYHTQLKALRGPLDLLIATPGRLMDLMNSGAAILANVELLVLDEADRMLDMGFIDDIHLIAKSLPTERQTMMFSATFAGHVGGLAAALTRSPKRINVDAHTDTHAQIEQRLHWADSRQHKQAMLEQILTDREMGQCLIFTSTQQDAEALAYQLGDIGHNVSALHGGMPQGRRNRVLQGLRSGHLKVLVATDVAARGIDVPTITHVINFGLPMKPEDYVHRIGRTGRAGRNGLAITLAERRDVGMIRRIERFTTQPIAMAMVPGFESKLPPPSASPSFGPGGRGSAPRPGSRFGNGNGGGAGRPNHARGFGGESFGQQHRGPSDPFGQARPHGDFAGNDRRPGPRPDTRSDARSGPRAAGRPDFGAPRRSGPR